MFDLMMSCGAAAAVPRYAGPERRSADSALWRWMAAMLDEIDYGMLLVTDPSGAVEPMVSIGTATPQPGTPLTLNDRGGDRRHPPAAAASC